jgi:hypothetical protein
MTITTFLLALATGAAVIGFWTALRFPSFGPTSFQGALLHVGVSMAAGWAAASGVSALAAEGRPGTIVALFGVLLPALVYTFLAAAWLMRLAWDRIGHYRH